MPVGLPGAKNLIEDPRFIDILKKFYDDRKWIGAICAGPISLQKAGIIKDKKFTCAPGFEDQLPDGCHQDTLVEVDGHIVTSRGPAASLEFAYTLLEKLGGDSAPLREGMQYNFLTK